MRRKHGAANNNNANPKPKNQVGRATKSSANGGVSITSNEKVRLNRYLANAGVCSRREADDIIKMGEVQVNGKVISEMGIKVNSSDEVIYKGKVLNPERKVYILLNKPKGYVTTVKDENAEKTVIDIIGGACNERVYPVGRLDKQTTGLLLLTNDGELTKRLTHPKYEKKKIYYVSLEEQLSKSDLDRIKKGITLEDGFIQADDIQYITEDTRREVGIEIHSGHKHIVRRIFAHFGNKVVKLDRVYFAGLTKKNLPRGKWRFLEEKEVTMLKRGTYN